VAGTFKERAGWHGCQMPEQLLGRIIRACSNEDDRVLDPFGGSGTTVAVAKKLGRQYMTFELSTEYAQRIEERLTAIEPGMALNGAPEPTVSAPSTADGKKLEDKQQRPKKKTKKKSKNSENERTLF
jgi:site-specific DNA-methyltransferase (adenine-specific)